MFVRCPYCGTGQVVDKGAYDSPIITCESCHQEFYENKISEPVLIDSIYIKKESLGFFVYSALVFGILFTVVGFITLFKEKQPFLLVTGFIVTAIMGGLIYWRDKDYRRKKERYDQVLDASKKRVAGKNYQTKLLELSGEAVSLKEAISRFNKIYPELLYEDRVEETYSAPLVNATVANVLSREQSDTLEREILFCNKCGARLPEDGQFCPKCGAKAR